MCPIHSQLDLLRGILACEVVLKFVDLRECSSETVGLTLLRTSSFFFFVSSSCSLHFRLLQTPLILFTLSASISPKCLLIFLVSSTREADTPASGSFKWSFFTRGKNRPLFEFTDSTIAPISVMLGERPPLQRDTYVCGMCRTNVRGMCYLWFYTVPRCTIGTRVKKKWQLTRISDARETDGRISLLFCEIPLGWERLLSIPDIIVKLVFCLSAYRKIF